MFNGNIPLNILPANTWLLYQLMKETCEVQTLRHCFSFYKVLIFIFLNNEEQKKEITNIVLKYTDFYLWISAKGKALSGKSVITIVPMFGLTTFLIPTETAMSYFQYDLTVEQSKHISYSIGNGILFTVKLKLQLTSAPHC